MLDRNQRACEEGTTMRKPALAAIFCIALGLPASAAGVGTTNSALAQHVAMHRVCYWVPSDGTLRPLLTFSPAPTRIIKPKAIAVASSPAAAPRSKRAHISVAPETGRRLAPQPPSSRLALVVGVAY
jgi:hypothetical protein